MHSSIPPYAPLHLRSCFSFGQGCLSPEAICSTARQWGFSAVGMVDANNFYGLVRFLKAAERQKIKPVVGMVLRGGAGEICTAYVLNRRGFVRLAEIVSGLDTVDPLANLGRHGWEGLALASDNREVLESLAGRERCGLHIKLTFGRDFAEALRFSRSSGIPPLAVNDALISQWSQAELCHLLRAVNANCTLEELSAGRRLRPEQILVAEKRMRRFFAAAPEALENAGRLLEAADASEILARKPVFPSYNGMGEAEAFRVLGSLCLREAQRRYCPGVRWRSRLDYELKVIRRKGFAGYFLVVRDIVSRCSRTCGRGSSAASLVSYLLGITHVDPLRYNLYFDRFLNLERSDPPDIDIDFPWDERERTLRYVFSRYPGRSAMVADHVRFGVRSAVRESAKAFGLPKGEIDRMVRFACYGETQALPPYLRGAAEKILGLPRNIGTHCGGVVITPRPLTCYTHTEISPSGYPLIAWDRESAEEAGLVKIDLLGNRSLAVLRDTLKLAGRPGRRSAAEEEQAFSVQKALGCAETRRLLARGDTLGIFYVESPATRQLLRKMGRGDYEHLIIASSIIRPAAGGTIREFLRRLHGGRYAALTPALRSILGQSYGLMVYQEDVCRVATSVAGFSAARADRLRKILALRRDPADSRPVAVGAQTAAEQADAAGSVARELGLMRDLFYTGARRRGIDDETLGKIWGMILSFRGYSFCKAHSASYALVSCKLAYLKRFFPLEFFVSVINNGGGYYSRQTYINECRRLGFPVLSPDVNLSSMAYTAQGGGLRVGLGELRGIKSDTLERLLCERRRRGRFSGYEDFLRRTRPTASEIRVLVGSGALDAVAGDLTRPQMYWLYYRVGRIRDLFSAGERPPELGDHPEALKVLDEIRTLGLIVSRHPVSLFRQRAADLVRWQGLPALISSREIPEAVGRVVSVVGLLVSGKEVYTRSREMMVFVSFEDEHSVFESVFFPAVFRRFFPLVDSGGVFLLIGKIESEMAVCTISVQRVSRLYADGAQDSGSTPHSA